MFKIVVAIRRKPHMTRDEFAAYYFDRHAPLARQVIPEAVAAGIIHYVQNHAIDPEAPYDCITEIGFADEEALRRWLAWYEGPEGAVLRDDEEVFVDQSDRIDIVARALRPGRDTLASS